MDSKKAIKFDLRIVSKDDTVKLDGISFSNIAYVTVFVEGVDLFTLEYFYGSFLVFKELKKSIEGSGKYLLFTSVSGIADDAGWDRVNVQHDENTIRWSIERDDSLLLYVFDKNDYLKEVSKLEEKIKNLNKGVGLEPLQVIYPE